VPEQSTLLNFPFIQTFANIKDKNAIFRSLTEVQLGLLFGFHASFFLSPLKRGERIEVRGVIIEDFS
jgi:hypothetical protein